MRSSLKQNEPSSAQPLRHLVIRSAILTTAIVMPFGEMLRNFDLKNYQILSKFLYIPESIIPTVFGIIIGFGVVWLAFPHTYSPESFKNFFPNFSIVFACWWILAPLGFFGFFGVAPSPFNVNSIMQFYLTPMYKTFSYIDDIAFFTYLLFFTSLGFMIKNKVSRSTLR